MKWCGGLVVSGDSHATTFGDRHGGGDFTRLSRSPEGRPIRSTCACSRPCRLAGRQLCLDILHRLSKLSFHQSSISHEKYQARHGLFQGMLRHQR